MIQVQDKYSKQNKVQTSQKTLFLNEVLNNFKINRKIFLNNKKQILNDSKDYKENNVNRNKASSANKNIINT